MTPEELMKPRYKVIADYPGTPFKVGQIIYPQTNGSSFWVWIGDDCIHIYGYDHLFHPLQWWEERKPEDMPEYVTLLQNQSAVVFKIKEWNGCNSAYTTSKTHHQGITMVSESETYYYFLPATKEEYESYINPPVNK